MSRCELSPSNIKLIRFVHQTIRFRFHTFTCFKEFRESLLSTDVNYLQNKLTKYLTTRRFEENSTVNKHLINILDSKIMLFKLSRGFPLLLRRCIHTGHIICKHSKLIFQKHQSIMHFLNRTYIIRTQITVNIYLIFVLCMKENTFFIFNRTELLAGD